MAETFFVGQLVEASVVFRDKKRTLVDPTAILAHVQEPDGTTTDYTYGTGISIVRDGVGRYHLNINIDASGEWTVLWEGTGVAQAAWEGTLVARSTAFD